MSTSRRKKNPAAGQGLLPGLAPTTDARALIGVVDPAKAKAKLREQGWHSLWWFTQELAKRGAPSGYSPNTERALKQLGAEHTKVPSGLNWSRHYWRIPDEKWPELEERVKALHVAYMLRQAQL